MTGCRFDFTDKGLFGNDAGEHENPEILSSYFVEQPAFAPFLDRSEPFSIARSRKGMGKSALLSKFAFDLDARRSSSQRPPIVVKARGAELIGLAPPPQTTNPLLFQNYWINILCSRVNFAIGAEKHSPLTDDDMNLRDGAERAGYKSRDFIGALLARLKFTKLPLELKIENYANHPELFRRAFAKLRDREVWLLVDDIDATFVDTPDHNLLVSSFFAACVAIAHEVKGLGVRTTVRNEVWTALRKNEALDKCEQYCIDISWTTAQLKAVLARKIVAYLEREGLQQDELVQAGMSDPDKAIGEAFEALRWDGGAWVHPFRPLNILSAGRPRWLSQLCRLAGKRAAAAHKPKIGMSEIKEVLPGYCRLRLSDIYKEHGHAFAALEPLIETFASGPPRYGTTELLDLLKHRFLDLRSNPSLELDGQPLHSPLQLAHFLFRTGFLVGRIPSDRESRGGSEFVRFEQRPELLVDERNLDDGMDWEIHPSYREALYIRRKHSSRREPIPA